MPGARLPIVDSHYAWLVPGTASFGDWLAERPAPVRAAALRFGVLRGLALAVASARRPAVATVRTDPGWRTLLLARALFGRRRKLVGLQFIVHPPRSSGPGALIDRVWAPLDRWATRRALAAGQVLTEQEREQGARRYGLDRDRFPHVAWPRRRRPGGELPPDRPDGPVVSAGRAFCDWPALFAAAQGADWPLVVVCSRADLPTVERLNAGGRAELRCELPADEYRALLAGASVAAFPMRDAAISQGHIRLMDANDAGVPAVITRAASLAGYVVEGETALVVPAGDSAALRAAIESLRGDAGLRARVRRAAWDFSQRWTGEDNLRAIAELLEGVAR